MKIFIINSASEASLVKKLQQALKASGDTVILPNRSIQAGTAWIEQMTRSMSSCDAVIALMSRAAFADDRFSREAGAAVVLAGGNRGPKLLAVLVETMQVPTYFAEQLFVDISADPQAGIWNILQQLDKFRPGPKRTAKARAKAKAATGPDTVASTRSQRVHELAMALRAGRLTLVCGAGCSIEAGIPNWTALLYDLLERTLQRAPTDNRILVDRAHLTSLQAMYSSLVIGRYLKNNLGADFFSEVREALYSKNPKTGKIIDAIVRLARPQRDGEPLDSIVTFNFDGLVEEQLRDADIHHRAVWSEGVRVGANELPIYHVHGYLPRKGPIEPDAQIVFSEDAYHSQFIEPFSWSNLVQLNKLTENTCLLIGLSLADPNLRRLLDVANRKNPEMSRNHFLIKKTPEVSPTQSSFRELVRLLEEQDANALGLNMIWVDDFADVPKVLDEIHQARNGRDEASEAARMAAPPAP